MLRARAHQMRTPVVYQFRGTSFQCTCVDDVFHDQHVLSLQRREVSAGYLHAADRVEALVRLDFDEVERERHVQLHRGRQKKWQVVGGSGRDWNEWR